MKNDGRKEKLILEDKVEKLKKAHKDLPSILKVPTFYVFRKR